MNEREQFERQFSNRPFKNDLGFYGNPDIENGWRGWKLCAKSKKSELDKANARIAQLERFITDNVYHDEKYDVTMTESAGTWLLEHDKAVEVRVLEEAENLCLNLPDSADTVMDCSEVLCRMIESRKYK